MKVALLSLACVACLTGCANDLQRSIYGDTNSINKYSRRNIMALAPHQIEVTPAAPRYPVRYPYGAYAYAPVTAPEHSYSTESVYDLPGYAPASYSTPYYATGGGFGGRAYRYQSRPVYYLDGGYGAYYGGPVIVGGFHRR